MSMSSEFEDQVVRTMQAEHDYVDELTKKIKLLEARVEQLEQKQ